VKKERPAACRWHDAEDAQRQCLHHGFGQHAIQLDADEGEEQAAGPRLKATGKPISRKTMSPANMIGARL
jgi:hypothetical protein